MSTINPYGGSNRQAQINSDWPKLVRDSDGYLEKYFEDLGFASAKEAKEWWAKEQGDANNKRDA